jgi:hypothetical protein
VKDLGLESGFDPVLDRIQHLAENGLTSLMVLHDFLSRRLAPLQDRPAHPAWIYTGVNDIMWLECSPGSSLDEVLLVACLKALTADQFSADHVVPAVVCEPICVNQVARIALLATMPTLDDIDITLVQRGDQSRNVVIPRAGGPTGAVGGHGWGGGPTGGHGGVSADNHGGVLVGGPTGGSGPAPSPGKGKQARVVLDDDVVSSDVDEPLQKRRRRLSGAVGPSGSRPAPAAPGAIATMAVAAD